MTAHASNFLPDTPTVAGALAYTRGTDFIFHAVNRLDKGTTGLMAVAKSGYVHDLLRRALTSAAERGYSFTDDCAAVESLGVIVKATHGSYENIKITTPEDVLTAEAFLHKEGC